MLGTARDCPYEDEDDIEELPPLAFALIIFNASEVEVVFPSRLSLLPWIWKRSDRLAIGEADLLSCGSAIGKSELGSGVEWNNTVLTGYVVLRTSTTSQRRQERHC